MSKFMKTWTTDNKHRALEVYLKGKDLRITHYEEL